MVEIGARNAFSGCKSVDFDVDVSLLVDEEPCLSFAQSVQKFIG